MAQKIPPPPFLTGELQSLNRWLLEIQSILQAGGDVNPDAVAGLPQVIAESAANSLAIAGLQTQVDDLTFITNSLQGQIGTINGALTTLGARAQVFNGALGVGVPSNGIGADNDWFYNRTGAAGNRLFIKLAGAWVAQAI